MMEIKIYTMTESIKKKDCFFQRRKTNERWQDPILMEVLKAIETNNTGRGIYKVRWHVIGRDCVHTSEFPMATTGTKGFMGFNPMSRELFAECVKILSDSKDYESARRRVIYRLKKLM